MQPAVVPGARSKKKTQHFVAAVWAHEIARQQFHGSSDFLHSLDRAKSEVFNGFGCNFGLPCWKATVWLKYCSLAATRSGGNSFERSVGFVSAWAARRQQFCKMLLQPGPTRSEGNNFTDLPILLPQHQKSAVLNGFCCNFGPPRRKATVFNDFWAVCQLGPRRARRQ